MSAECARAADVSRASTPIASHPAATRCALTSATTSTSADAIPVGTDVDVWRGPLGSGVGGGGAIGGPVVRGAAVPLVGTSGGIPGLVVADGLAPSVTGLSRVLPAQAPAPSTARAMTAGRIGLAIHRT
jgi:hypothetical protein